MNMEVGTRVRISNGCKVAVFVGMTGEIASVEAWGFEVRIDGDGYETPFYAYELEVEQIAA